MIDKGK
ncbi:hypothetical protein CP061683_0903A, partial [Chlamydia psittaci 06-1683]